MMSIKTGDEIYDVNKYTDIELYGVLDLTNPTDRELEARIYHLIKKYKGMENSTGNKLAKFFEDIYDHFFEIAGENEPEEFENDNIDEMNDTQNVVLGQGISVLPEGQIASVSNLTTQMEYRKDFINPLLKQTITRIVSIDSQFRNNKRTTLSTNYAFNLSDTLRDVVSIRMNSVHIPKTWYTISKSYGANFFYLKGTSEGINDGLHDYQISVAPGNYSQTELVGKLNESIQLMKSNNTDIDFSNTIISYDPNTCKSSITLFIKSIYNETDYYLNFDYFTYPSDDAVNGIYKSIASFLGFDEQNHEIGTFHSNYDLSGTGHPPIDQNGSYYDYSDNNELFLLTNSNNYFTIVNYDGYYNNTYITHSDPQFNDASYNTFTIKSSLPIDISYSRLDIVNDFSAQMHASPYLSPTECGIKRYYISDTSHNSYGYSYFEFLVHLNKKTTKNAVNQKTVVFLPNDTTIWLSDNSCFHFDLSANETSNVIASTKYTQSDYTIGENVYFTVECDASGYYKTQPSSTTRDFSKNDVTVTLNAGNYILSTYIDEINLAIRRADISNNHIFDPLYISDISYTNVTGFAINDSSEYNLRMRYYVHKEFTSDTYLFDTTNSIFNSKLGFSSAIYSNYDFSKNTFGVCDISGSIIPSSGNNYSINEGDILFTIKPNTIRTDVSFGNYYADPFIITYDLSNKTQQSAGDLTQILNVAIKTWRDPILNQCPFKNVIVKHEPRQINGYNYIIWSIDLSNILVSLSSTNYKVIFYDDANSWSDNLKLDNSYNLANYPLVYTNVFDVSYTDVLGTDKIFKNLLTIKKNVNDTISLISGASGLVDINGGTANNRVLTIPPGTYSVNKLIVEINGLFSNTPNWKGSSIQPINGYIVININTNKVFDTSDYRIVFYDPYSFVRCFVGSSSVRNTSWDTTVGWILGFRELSEYPLGPEYSTPDANDPNIFYYGDTISVYTYNSLTNTMTIVSDTTVSVNLFNYFMIVLDDYTQNHLNDGLVTITPAESNTDISSYANKSTIQCDPVTGEKIFTGTVLRSGNKNTEKQIYSANQKIAAKRASAKIYSSGPFVQDIFALIPLSTSNLAPGAIFTDTGSGLAKQERIYFGPVNISRMTIKLINDRGDIVDLNGSDWSCSIQCDQLYQQKSL